MGTTGSATSDGSAGSTASVRSTASIGSAASTASGSLVEHFGSHGAFDGSLVVAIEVVVGASEEAILLDGKMAVETSLVVDSIALGHSCRKDDDGSQDDGNGQEGSDDHQQSSALHGSSVLVDAGMEKMDKDEPRDPADDHENENGGVDPLERGIVLVDGVVSDA